MPPIISDMAERSVHFVLWEIGREGEDSDAATSVFTELFCFHSMRKFKRDIGVFGESIKKQ